MIIENLDFDKTLILAHKQATEMVKNGLFSRFGLNIEARLNKALLGCLGELAFEHWLKSKNYIYAVDREGFENRNADNFDFLINNKKIDIKVAKKSTSNTPNNNWAYGYPKQQKPETKDYVIIGWIDLPKKEVVFYGWLTGLAISTYSVVTKNSFAGYNYLTPNHEFKWGNLNNNFELLIKEIFTI